MSSTVVAQHEYFLVATGQRWYPDDGHESNLSIALRAIGRPVLAIDLVGAGSQWRIKTMAVRP